MVKKFISFSVSPNNGSDINGIFHQIPSIQVEAYASSIHHDHTNETRGPQHAINPLSSVSYCSDNIPNQWIVINFTNQEIFATHYGAQSIGPEYGGEHAKQWKVDGFKFGEWIQIDNVIESHINGHFLVETRKFSDIGPFSAFKFTNMGLNWINSYYFRFLNIDFFGFLIFGSPIFCSLKTLSFFDNNVLYILLILITISFY